MKLAEVYHADRCRALARAAKDGRADVCALARNGYPGARLSAKAIPALCTVGRWDIRAQQNWGLDWHRNEGLELCYVASGSIWFESDERGRLLRSGALTITHPWQRHRLGAPCLGANRLHWMILDLGASRPNDPWQWPSWICLERARLRAFERRMASTKCNVWRGTPAVERCFLKIEECIKSYKCGGDTSELILRLNELILLADDAVRAVGDAAPLNPSAYSVEVFLEGLAADRERLAQKWSVDAMARACGVSATHFFNFCKKITNKTPAHFLAAARVRHAAQMLKTGACVTETALACGFGTGQYFSTVFRRLTGKTPRAFRRSA